MSSVGSRIHVSSGFTTSVELTAYSQERFCVTIRIVSWRRIFRSARKKVSRWPASAMFPRSPGSAVEGMWPTAIASVLSSVPSRTIAATPMHGISMRPRTSGSVSGVVTGSGVTVTGEVTPPETEKRARSWRAW